MPVIANINYYSVVRCGYYPVRGNRNRMGNLNQFLADLHGWTVGRNAPLAETSTIPNHDGNGDNLPIYCFDIKIDNNTQTAVLITWNRVPADQGVVTAVQANSLAGHATVHNRAFAPTDIPGYPAYFWFDIQNSVMATIRFSASSLNGHQGLRMYACSYLENFSPQVVAVADPNNNTVTIRGYRMNQNDNPNFDLRPQFMTKPMRSRAQIDVLRRRVNDIYKLHRKKELSWNVPQQKSFYLKFLRICNLHQADPLQDVIHFQSEIDIAINENKFDLLVEKYDVETDNHLHPRGVWSDIGFKFRRDTKIYWLSGTTVKCQIELDTDRDDNGIVSANSLLASTNLCIERLRNNY